MIDVPAYDVIEELEHGPLVRFLEGPLAGREVVLAARAMSESSAAVRSLTPEQRANELLLSLLTPQQRSEWASRQRFTVLTRFGTVELGEKFNIRYCPNAGGEYRLCVVPNRCTDLPGGDVWVNLLLWLQHDPRWFLTVANWRRCPHGEWNFGPVPGIRDA